MKQKQRHVRVKNGRIAKLTIIIYDVFVVEGVDLDLEKFEGKVVVWLNDGEEYEYGGVVYLGGEHEERIDRQTTLAPSQVVLDRNFNTQNRLFHPVLRFCQSLLVNIYDQSSLNLFLSHGPPLFQCLYLDSLYFVDMTTTSELTFNKLTDEQKAAFEGCRSLDIIGTRDEQGKEQRSGTLFDLCDELRLVYGLKPYL